MAHGLPLPLPGGNCPTCQAYDAQMRAAQQGQPGINTQGSAQQASVQYKYYYAPALGGPYPWDVATPAPKLDVAKIDQLATVEARKVKPKIVIPDLTTCIIGWRGWRVTTSGNEYRLQGLGRDAVWEPKKPVKAECRKDVLRTPFIFGDPFVERPKPHDCPDKDCSCGVWAFRDLNEFKKMGESYSSTAVVGQVYLWGRVLECENGYRAQFAVPKELWIFDPEHESLGIHYNCPIRSLRAAL